MTWLMLIMRFGVPSTLRLVLTHHMYRRYRAQGKSEQESMWKSGAWEI